MSTISNARWKISPVRRPATLLAVLPFLWGLGGAAYGSPAKNAPLPSQARALVLRARDAAKGGDYRVAVLLLKNALQLAPQNGPLRAQLGSVLVMDGDMAEAERELRQARSRGAPDGAVLPALFQAMLSRREGADLLTQFPEPKPQDRSSLAADIWRARALAHFAQGDGAAATSDIDKALAIRQTAPYLLNKAQFALARGDRGEAAGLTDLALKAAPKDVNVLITKMGLLEAAGDFTGAVTYADRLVAEEPNTPLPRILRIEVLGKLRRDSAAKADIDWLLRRDPNMPIALYDRALVRARGGDVKGAWEIAQALPPEFVHTQPQFEVAVASLANVSGNRQIAEADLEAAISNFPKYEESRIRLAGMRLADKDPQGVITLLEPIKTSTDPRVPTLLAAAYKASGRTAQAQAVLAAARSPDGDPALGAALSALQAGKSEQGIAELSALARKDPSRSDVAAPLIGGLLASGQADAAMQVANRFAAAAGSNALGPFYRGQVMMATGDLDGAAAAFSNALTLKADFPAALYYRAQVMAARGDLARANADLDRLLRLNPSDAQALTKKAQYAAEAGRDGDAVPLFQRAVAAARGDPAPQLALAAFYLSRRQYAKAQGAAGALARAGNPEALALVARSQMAGGDMSGALKTARAGAAAAPKSAAAQILFGNLLEAAKDRDGAQKAYAQAITAEPANIAGYKAAAALMLVAHQNGAALALARQFAGAHPGKPATLFLADSLNNAGQGGAARKLLLAAMAQHPDSDLVLALADLEAASDAKAARARLAGWLAKHPGDGAVAAHYASLLIADGDLAAARGPLENLVRKEPYNASALNDLAWTLQKSDPKRALQLAAKASHIAPRSAEFLDTLGWLQWQQNDRAGALASLRQAHALRPQEPEIGYHFAVALDGAGDRAGARAALLPILKTNVNFQSRDAAQKLEAAWR